MERVTLRVPSGLLDDVEEQVERGVYANRSEAFRAALRELPAVGEPRVDSEGRVLTDGSGGSDE